MADMKALQVSRHGQPGDVLEVRSVERPEPGPGEVRVKVGAASLNFNDIDRCRGNLVSVPTPPPFTLGMDVCGVVDAAGEGAEAWSGKRVVAITKNALGGIAEYAIADAISVFDAPERVRRRGGDRVRPHVPGLSPRALPAGPAPDGRDVGGALRRERPRHGRHPTGQGRRGQGHRGGRRPREDGPVHHAWGQTSSSTTRRRTSSRRSSPPRATREPTSSTT